MEQKLYIELRLFVNPNSNQETLHEMAKEFQEGIHDIWNFGDNDIKVTDVTYEIVMEISHKNHCAKCGKLTGPAFGLCSDCIKTEDK